MSASGKWSASTKMRTKLTASQVQDIRILYNRGDCTQAQLSRDFGVTVIQIGRIVRNEVWQNLPPPTPDNKEQALQFERLMKIQEEQATPGLDKLQQIHAEIQANKKIGTDIIDLLSEDEDGTK